MVYALTLFAVLLYLKKIKKFFFGCGFMDLIWHVELIVEHNLLNKGCSCFNCCSTVHLETFSESVNIKGQTRVHLVSSINLLCKVSTIFIFSIYYNHPFQPSFYYLFKNLSNPSIEQKNHFFFFCIKNV